MESNFVAFRIAPDMLEQQLRQFNARGEVQWFGFLGAFEAPASATGMVAPAK